MSEEKRKLRLELAELLLFKLIYRLSSETYDIERFEKLEKNLLKKIEKCQ